MQAGVGEAVEAKTVLDPTGKSQKSSCSSLSTLSSDIYCRICHGSEEEEELYSHCQCKGSIGLTHPSCLIFWIKKSGTLTCELCKGRYTIATQLNKRFWQWKLPCIGTKGWLKLVFFIGFLSMLITFTTWIIWSRVSSSAKAQQERSKKQVEYTYLVYGMLVVIAIIGMYALNLRPFIGFMNKLLVVNQDIMVVPKGELCMSKLPNLDSWKEDDERKLKHVTLSQKDSCKHELEIESNMKSTCVQVQGQVQECGQSKYDLSRYIMFDRENCNGDLSMV